MKTFFILFFTFCINYAFGQPKETKINSISRFYTHSIYSKSLGEYRKHDIYLPPGFDGTKKYAIMYATDGGCELTEKKQALDSLIKNKIIKPFIFVASHSNEKIADSTSTKIGDGKKVILSYRNFEYVDRTEYLRPEDSILKNIFANHLNYFQNELISEIERQFNQKLKKADRYFYGVSNGAGFGISLLNKNPDIIGTYLCFSIFGGKIETSTWTKGIKYPNLYIRYGSEEVFFLKSEAKFLKKKYKKFKLFCSEKEFKGNHNNRFWIAEFDQIISDIFKLNK